MTRPIPRRERARLPLGAAASLLGGAAVVLSLAGQFYAATDYAADVNSGHPMADAHLTYLLAVAPSILMAVLAVGVGAVACSRSRGARAWGAVGIGLGLLAVVLSVLQFPADLMAEHWIEPYPGGLR